MGCCLSCLHGLNTADAEAPGHDIDSDIGDLSETPYVNDDGGKDSAPLLSPQISKVQISASSSTSEIDKDMIQRLLAEVDELSD